MTEDPVNLPSLKLITKYMAAFVQQDTLIMQTLRASEYILDWVHGDAF